MECRPRVSIISYLWAFDRPYRQAKVRGDLLHALAFHDQPQDVTLPRRQLRLRAFREEPAMRSMTSLVTAGVR